MKQVSIGYPVNFRYDYSEVFKTLKYHYNNIGDPYQQSHYKTNTKLKERKVLKFFKELWGISDDKSWGYLTSSGTEGNLQGLYIGREVYPNGILYCTKESHYSIFKIARILKLKLVLINVQNNGEMDYIDLRCKIDIKKPVIICVNLGSTMKCAHDSVSMIHAVLAELKIKNSYIHVDGALNGFLFPFLKDNLYFKKYVNSMSISGHKFLGVPFPCGVFLMEKTYVDKISTSIEYIDCTDNTISGSRNGHSAVFMEYMINLKGYDGFKKDVNECVENAQFLEKSLKELGLKVWKNIYATTVVIEKLSDDLCKKWELAIQDDICHVVVMPHVTKDVLIDFLNDVKNEINN